MPVNIEIASVETPLPGQVVLRGLKIVPSNSGRYPELNGFSANEVNIQFGFLQNEISFVEPVELESHAMAETLQRMFSELDENSLNNEKWQISFNKVVLRDSVLGTRDFVMKPLSVTLAEAVPNPDSGQSKFQARILARPQGIDLDEQISVQFEKDSTGQYVDIDTHNGYLPANLLKHLVAEAPVMGASSLFRGRIIMDLNADNRASGSITGDIFDLRLDSLPDHGPSLTGYCDVRDLMCQIENGRIKSGEITVRSNHPISVDSSLFKDSDKFGIELSVDADSERVSIANLDLGILLNSGNVFFSAPRATIERFGTTEQAECFAFDSKGEPLAICNSRLSTRKSVPLNSLAKILTGQSGGNRSIDFLDNFDLPDRTADGSGNGTSIR